MARGNGKSEVDPAELDPEHELPASDDTQERDERRSLPGKARSSTS